jgi:hypothetical protein
MSNIKLYLENNSNYNLKNKQSQEYGAPYVRPCALDTFLTQHEIDYQCVAFDDCDYNTWYPVNIYFFDFDCDYFTYFDNLTLDKIRNKKLRVLFIYSEPDDPYLIEKRLQELCDIHAIDRMGVFLLTGNTVSDQISGQGYLQYHEFLYEQQNKTASDLATAILKEKKYTCLNRIHKQYRKEFVWNLWNNDLIDDQYLLVDKHGVWHTHRRYSTSAYVSYGNVPNIDTRGDFDIINDSFIAYQTKRISHVPATFDKLLPLRADHLTTAEHNNHSINVDHFHTNSYWNIALETYIDASGGTFLTEKTFKPIKYGQAFVILGTENSLGLLKDQGYKTFDRWIDESYDTITDVRFRWYAVFEETRKIALKSLEQLHLDYLAQLPIIHHNQEHFKRNKQAQLVKCLQRLTAQQ